MKKNHLKRSINQLSPFDIHNKKDHEMWQAKIFLQQQMNEKIHRYSRGWARTVLIAKKMPQKYDMNPSGLKKKL